MVDEAFDDPRITAMGLLTEVSTGLRARIAPTLAGHGMSVAEFEVLIRLGRSAGGRLRMADLATQTMLSTSGVTRVVDRLERDGLVRRESCAQDRRGLYAVLTRTGADRLAAAVPDHVADVETWFTGRLGPQESAALLHALRILRDAVRPGATAGAEPPPLAEPAPIG